MAVTLAEEIMLLCLDGESGVPEQRQAAGWAVAGGILLELVLAGRASVEGKYLKLTDRTPTGERLLDDRMALLGTWLRDREKRRVTEWLTKDRNKAASAATESLCARGVLVEQEHRALGLFPTRRYPEVDGAPETEVRQRLRAVVLDGAAPDERTAGLIALLHAAKLHRVVFPDTPRKEVAGRMAEIAAGQWAAEGVRAAIRDMQAAVAAVAVAASVSAGS
ncbi:GPP34 family phosphoprotein [Streptomyces sp. RS10V-4]|uniref:GOLPH3/VPS74 family protein n=1 Tax=Streptomyces rhizoryzae TaxID=2932493 RepID=UPI0020062859|nr:GPP34 family phosphoprotein [Streptomyces rhizoryzae]MCK7621671.1 GPP34 family phosphoprotein [Streptomyces rhizoryzae]